MAPSRRPDSDTSRVGEPVARQHRFGQRRTGRQLSGAAQVDAECEDEVGRGPRAQQRQRVLHRAADSSIGVGVIAEGPSPGSSRAAHDDAAFRLALGHRVEQAASPRRAGR